MKKILALIFALALAAGGADAAVVFKLDTYVGLSSDTKPVYASDLSRFYESDTRKHFLKVSGTWQEVTDHANLANKGSNTHDDIDAFISSKGQSSGLASLDANGDVLETIQDANVLVQKNGGPNIITTLQDVVTYSWSAAILSGGGITDNGDGTVSTATGEAMLRTSASESATLMSTSFPAANNLALTNNATNYVYADYNAGSPQILVTTSSADFNCEDKCHLYTISREGTKLHIIDARNQNVDANRKLRRRFYDTGVLEHTDGGTNLSSPSARYLAVSAGSFYYALVKHTHDAYDTSVAGTANANVYDTYYRDGAGGWTKTVDQKSIDNASYDDSDGTLGSLTASYYGIHWAYLIVGTTPRLAIIYGQGNYATLNDAKAAATLVSVPPAIAGNGVLIGRVIIQQGASTITETSSAFATTFEAGGVPLHNSLASIQGGTTNEYYHMTNAQSGALHARSHALDSGSDHSGRLALNQLTDNDTTASLCLVSGGAGGEPNYITCPGGGGGAPVDGEYTTYSANTTLTNERVWNNGTNTTVDIGTAGQIKINVPAIPTDISGASFVTKVAETNLSNEFALGSLSTGLLKNTTTTGVPTIASSGTDYGPPTSGNATGLIISTTGTGAHTAYGGTSCTNQFNRSLNASGAATCAGVGVADFTANQGTTTQVLHGNAAGQPSWGGIVGADLPNPGASTLGGVKSLTCGGTDKLSAIGTDGLPVCSTDQTAGGGPTTAKLTSDYTNSTTTGTNVSGLNVTLAAGTWRYSYWLAVRIATIANASDFGVNFTGTQTLLTAQLTYQDTGVSTSNGIIDDVITGDGAETVVAGCVNTAVSTTVPNLNCFTSSTTAATNMFVRVEGMIVVTVSGTLQLYAASEAATEIRVMTGSTLLATPF